jgi:hypothetical protein
MQAETQQMIPWLKYFYPNARSAPQQHLTAEHTLWRHANPPTGGIDRLPKGPGLTGSRLLEIFKRN